MNDISPSERLAPSRWKEDPWSIPAGLQKTWAFIKRSLHEHPVYTALAVLVVVLGLYIERQLLQVVWIFVRIYLPGVLIAGGVALGLWWWLKRYSVRVRTFGGILATAVAFVGVFFGRGTHDYFAQYLRYETLQVTERSEPLISDKERILPLRAIHTMARDRMATQERPAEPDIIRSGEKLYWSMAIEPSQFWGKLLYPIDQVMWVPSTDASPDIGKSIVPVHFNVGENLRFSRNTDTCVRRAFGLWRSMSYEPGNVLYLPDGSGKTVQVVLLTKWVGWIFPWPEFGGVQIIEQGDTNIAERLFLGCGRWIPPEEVGKHTFLVGQNIVPYEVSRFRAASLRFHGGSNWFTRLFSPLRWIRQGDVVIADIPDDMNQQPFTLFFRKDAEDTGKLYHYFCLETTDSDTHGLAVSFWYPADGLGEAFEVPHGMLGQRLLGCTSIRDRVEASRRSYKWGANTVAEARPYIHPIADAKGRVKLRFLYMTTLVTFTEKKSPDGSEIRFTAGGTPEVALVDADRERVVWVDTYHPEKWDEQVWQELGALWAQE